ncbi:MAG: hypothetical protein IIY77_08900 [Lachnospiraceae bacterium]|nr:hypothetical protein [Lachnospiraceae bacterium]
MCLKRVNRGLFTSFLILFLLLNACQIVPASNAVPNDMGDKADAALPRLKDIARDESSCYLALITDVSHGMRESGGYDSSLYEYLDGRKGKIRYLYGKDKDIETDVPEGISFDADKNRLILNDFQGQDVMVLTEKMGSLLHLEVHGDSFLNSLQIYNGGLQIEGNGKLTVESTTTDAGIYINSWREYAYLIIQGNVTVSVGSTAPFLIQVDSKQTDKNFFYLEPLKMSDGKRRIKMPEVKYGSMYYIENQGEEYYAVQSYPEDGFTKLYKTDFVTFAP